MENNEKKINPVMKLACETFAVMADGGNVNAEILGKMIGMGNNFSPFLKDAKEDPIYDRIVEKANNYNYVAQMIKDAGNKNVIDVSCGFSPMGLELAMEGYNYIGIDMPEVVHIYGPAVEHFISSGLEGTFKYGIVDILNPDYFQLVGDIFEGSITVVCQGLFKFFQPDEAEKFATGVNRILDKKGGCFITPDIRTE